MEIQKNENNPSELEPSHTSVFNATSTETEPTQTGVPLTTFSEAAQWAPTAFWILILIFLLRFFYKVLTASRNREDEPRPEDDPAQTSGESGEGPDTIDVTVPRRSMTSLLSGEMSERYRDCNRGQVENSSTNDAQPLEELPVYRPVPRHRLRIHEMSFHDAPEPTDSHLPAPTLFDFTRSVNSSASDHGLRTRSPEDRSGTSCVIIIGVDETASGFNYAAREQQNRLSEIFPPALIPILISRPPSTRSEFRFDPPVIPPPTYAP